MISRLSNYEKALKKSPGNPDAQFNQGDALIPEK